MRPGWKQVARRADNLAYAIEDVSKAIGSALEADCRKELTAEFIEAIRAFCRHQESSLFRDLGPIDIEALRPLAGSGLGKAFLDNVAPLSVERVADLDLLAIKALSYALEDRATRGARQMDEHYCREASRPKLENLRARIDRAVAGSPFEAIARRVLDLNSEKPARLEMKQRGLDDGVSLP
jgi:hypothetical protein